ncbi:tetratricopeptide repeat protein [Chryseobacterium daecheongense]|nr:tetratricopeptide repeat protein [Chryseobacterium daecheongense]
MKYLYFLCSLCLLYSCKKNSEVNFPEKNYNSHFYNLAKSSDDEKTAFKYFNYAKDDYLNKKDSLMAGKSLINMAIILSNQGDNYGSLQTSIEANKILKNSTSKETFASNYNCMAIVSENLRQYDKSIEYYQKAIEYTSDTIIRLAYLNNIGNSYLLNKNYLKALEYFKQVLKNKKSIINKVDYARVINNYAKASYLINPNYNPIPIYEKSLQIRIKEKDLQGQNYVLASFTDFYQNKDNQKALSYALQRYSVAKAMKNPDDQLETLQKLIVLDPTNYLKYFNQFQSINDSTQIARSSSKYQFALIRYETEEKNAENMRLKADKAQKDSLFFKQSIILLIVILALVITIVLYRKRQIRLKQENELRIKENQLKLSKKVHDVVANGIYQVMTKIENQESFSKDEALDELEFVYEKSRDISYEKTDLTNNEKNFNEKISELIGSFNNDTVKTYLAGNDASIWKGLQESTLTEVYQIVRELLVNMKKHSRADRVVFRFERENEFIKIYYTDNGIGIPGDIIYKNGLSSTVSRIETIKGEIIFDTKTERGLKINISFPVS